MAENEVVIKARMEVIEAEKGLKKLVKSAKATAREVAEAQQSVYRANEALNKTLGKRQFAGWALSIMFAGQAAKTAFNTIWQTGSKTFNDIMHSVEGTTTGFDALNNSVTYLQFVAGQALEPIAQALAPIVDFFAELIQDHPTAFAWLFGIGTFLATAVTAGGFLVLATNGFLDLAAKIGLAKTNAEGLVSMNWSKMSSAISKGIGTIAIGYGLVQTAESLKEFQDGTWIDGTLKAVGGIAQIIGGIMMLKGKGGGPLILVGFALELIAEDKFMQSIWNVVGPIGAAFEATVEFIKQQFDSLAPGIKTAFYLAMAAALASLGQISLASNFAKKAFAVDTTATEQPKTWEELFKTNLQDSLAGAKNIDAWIKEAKSAVQSITQVKFNNDLLGTEAIKQLVSQSFGSLNAPISFQNKDFQEQIINSIGTIEIKVEQRAGENELDFANRLVIELMRAIQARTA